MSPAPTGAGYRPRAGSEPLARCRSARSEPWSLAWRVVGLRSRPGSISRVATDTFPVPPVWTAHGERLIYASARDARAWNLWSRRADGAGDERRLSTSDEVQNPLALSPDGSHLVLVPRVGADREPSRDAVRWFGACAPALFYQNLGIPRELLAHGRWLARPSFNGLAARSSCGRFPRAISAFRCRAAAASRRFGREAARFLPRRRGRFGGFRHVPGRVSHRLEAARTFSNRWRRHAPGDGVPR